MKASSNKWQQQNKTNHRDNSFRHSLSNGHNTTEDSSMNTYNKPTIIEEEFTESVYPNLTVVSSGHHNGGSHRLTTDPATALSTGA